jgi:hypothetical protein
VTLNGIPGDEAIYLTWEANTSLPASTTWRISYAGPPGDQPSPISGLPETTRSYTLTGLTNYVTYTVTLQVMQDGAPILGDTVRVMPTDKFVFLPQIANELQP